LSLPAGLSGLLVVYLDTLHGTAGQEIQLPKAQGRVGKGALTPRFTGQGAEHPLDGDGGQSPDLPYSATNRKASPLRVM
jgi:hypothetical protein